MGGDITRLRASFRHQQERAPPKLSPRVCTCWVPGRLAQDPVSPQGPGRAHALWVSVRASLGWGQ